MTVVGIFLWKQLHEFLLNPQRYRLYDFAIDVARKLVNIEITDGSQIEKIKLSDLLCIMKYFAKNFSELNEILFTYLTYAKFMVGHL